MNKILPCIIALAFGASIAHAEKHAKGDHQKKPPKAQAAAATGKPKAAAPAAPPTPAPTAVPSGPGVPVFDTKGSNQPTYINSQGLTLFTEQRKFVYTGGVQVTQGDMTLTSDSLEGTYDESNKIQTLTAIKDVVILKGPNMKGTGQRAVYDAKTNTAVLTETPQLEQEGSLLTADLIRIFLDDNRSTAEGNVRVTVVQKSDPLKKEEKELKKG